MTRLAVIGMGHVGLVTSAGLAAIGHDVVGIDVDVERVTLLQAGGMPIYEPGLADLVDANVAAGRLRFTTSYADGMRNAQAVFIAVSTPTDESGLVDLSAVQSAATTALHSVETGSALPTVVVKSTCPVGTADGLELSLAMAAGKPVSVVVN